MNYGHPIPPEARVYNEINELIREFEIFTRGQDYYKFKDCLITDRLGRQEFAPFAVLI